MKTHHLMVLLLQCVWCDARISQYAFPDTIKFGVATSSIQVEGGWNQSDKAESIWDHEVHTRPEVVLDHSTADVAADSYHRYKEDVKLVYDMGLDIYRFSISWSRIFPSGFDDKISQDGVDYYNNLINEVLKYNITPMVSIYHWELPQRLQDFGGWTNPLIVDYFEDYSRVVFKMFGDRVKMWITLNEPHQTCHFGYGDDYMAPLLDSPGIGEYLCAHHHILAHARVYHMYDEEFREKQNGTIGITMDTYWGEPRTNSSEDIVASEIYVQMHLGMYSHPIFSECGDYPEIVKRLIDDKSKALGYSRSRLLKFSSEEIKYVKGTSDFFGINHYTTKLVHAAKTPSRRVPSLQFDSGVVEGTDPLWPTTQSIWHRVVPYGLRKVLNWIKSNYGKDLPIIITENGVSDFVGLQDYNRVDYFNLYLEQLLFAIHEDKCNVVAYIAWSLMDSFEWNTGYTESFGLHHVDFLSPEKTRTPRLSAKNLKEIVRSRVIDFDFIKRPAV